MKCQNWSKSPATSKGENSRVGCGQEAIVCIYKSKEILRFIPLSSPNAIEACNQRGLKNTHVQNILEMDSD
jgi:hypothetical protein